jgi:hypothetical protein
MACSVARGFTRPSHAVQVWGRDKVWTRSLRRSDAAALEMLKMGGPDWAEACSRGLPQCLLPLLVPGTIEHNNH